jgi:hypothetical protein
MPRRGRLEVEDPERQRIVIELFERWNEESLPNGMY